MDSRRRCVQPMMTSYELRSLLRDEMATAGFIKQGRTWVRGAGELLWIAQFEKSPYAERFSLDIGLALLQGPSGPLPAKAGDCRILMRLENLPLVASRQIRDSRFSDFRSAVIIGFDLAYDMENEERRQLIGSIVEALGEYISKIDNVQDLRVRYRAGDLNSAFLRKDVSQLLASD
jgi:hypothetical protein